MSVSVPYRDLVSDIADQRFVELDILKKRRYVLNEIVASCAWYSNCSLMLSTRTGKMDLPLK